MIEINTVIIGGGISGLSAGHFLKKKGVDFVIIESDNEPGGVIKSIKKNGFIYENGPNTILNNNSSINQILKDYDLLDQKIKPGKQASSNRYVYHNENPQVVPTSFIKFLRTPLLSINSKINIFLELFKSPHKKNTSVLNFISRRFGKEFHDNLIEPFLTGVYAGDTSNMSTKHALKKIWLLEQKFGSILKGLYRTKRQNFESFNFSNGINSLTNIISKSLDKNLITKTKVIKVKKNKNKYEVKTDAKKTFVCKNIISSIPSFDLEKIIFRDEIKDKLATIKYNPVGVFHFSFLKKEIGNNLNGFGILTKPSDNKNFLGVIFSSKIFPHICSDKFEVYTVMVGGEKQKSILKKDKINLKKLVLDDLRKLIKCHGKLEESNFYIWKKGIPQYNLYQEEIEKSIKLFHSKNKGFHLIGNYFGGVSVSDCIKKADDLVSTNFD
tara:strand:- start:761 stop:2080 length:1320 start_codon:yes stop_codon:yes gene_type:complete